jgi:hypothetical protein
MSLAFEYQGETHYFSTPTFGRASERQRVDKMKRDFARRIGITLIPIPFWWNKSQTSLGATIQSYRPDFNITQGKPIPTEIPKELNEARLRLRPNSAKEYDNRVNPTGWYAVRI